MNEKTFKCLSLKEQNTVLFNNVVEIRTKINGYKFYQKITAVLGTALTAGVLFLFKLHL